MLQLAAVRLGVPFLGKAIRETFTETAQTKACATPGSGGTSLLAGQVSAEESEAPGLERADAIGNSFGLRLRAERPPRSQIEQAGDHQHRTDAGPHRDRFQNSPHQGSQKI